MKLPIQWILLFLLLCPIQALAGPPRVSMDNSPMFISDQSIHTFTIRVDSVDELFAFSITVNYDATAIDVLGAFSLDFLSNTGSSTARFLDYSTPGVIEADESILGISPQTASSGGLITVFFRVPTGQAGVAKKIPIITSSCRMRDEINHTINCASDTGWIYLYPALVRTKVFLQGPFVSSTSSMHNQLRNADYLDQRTSPYALDPIAYNRQLPANVVDWVLVQLRSTYNGAVLRSKSCFLRTDGRIVYPDSTASNDVPFDVTAGNYYIIVRHRNHLGVQSANAIALGSAVNTTLYDFTAGQGQAYGVNPMRQLTTAHFGLFAGDASQNGIVRYNGVANDRAVVLSVVGLVSPNNQLAIFHSADVNLDSIVRYNGVQNDRALILSTLGLLNPNSAILSQIP